MNQPLNRDRLIELLVDDVTNGLSTNERQELAEFGVEQLIDEESQYFELTAAAIDLATTSPDQQMMPKDVRDRMLMFAGEQLCGGPSTNDVDSEVTVQTPQKKTSQTSVELNRSVSAAPSWREALSYLAAAACIILLVTNLNWPGSNSTLPTSVKPDKQPNVVPDTPGQKMAKLVGDNESELLDWIPVGLKVKPELDPRLAGVKASGQVVWHQKKQEGYMRFLGLLPNDPKEFQYQLWIFEDPDQDFPIDGGVFDITSADQTIPIDAKILVQNRPVQFAITIERPGGVVVSKREQIPLLARAD